MLFQFIIFAGSFYYPCGGWNDFRGSFDTVEECQNYLLNNKFKFDWFQIVHRDTGEIIK